MADCMCVVFLLDKQWGNGRQNITKLFLINRTIQIWYALHIWLLDRISGVSTKFTKMEVTMHRSSIISNTIYSNDFSFDDANSLSVLFRLRQRIKTQEQKKNKRKHNTAVTTQEQLSTCFIIIALFRALYIVFIHLFLSDFGCGNWKKKSC